MNQFDVIGTQYLGYAAPQVFAGGVGHQTIPGRELMRRNQPHTGGGLDSVKEWLDKKSVANIPNKYFVAAAALGGVLYFGHREGWF